MLTDFTKLEAWKEAMMLAKEVHDATRSFPKEEMYGIVSQMRRASLSVAANIAEGFGRYTFADKLHKYVQARGELIELMTEIIHASNVEYLKEGVRSTLLSRCETVHKLLNGLISKMKKLSSCHEGAVPSPKSQVPSPSRPGFTLIELLLAMGVIGVLATIVIVAINPKKQLCDAENARRAAMQHEMTNALFQYVISTSDLPPNIPTSLETAKQICRAGIQTGDTCVNLDALVPDFLAALPVDVSETNATLTGYKVYANVGRPTVVAAHYGTCDATAEVAVTSSSASSSEGSVVGFRVRPGTIATLF